LGEKRGRRKKGGLKADVIEEKSPSCWGGEKFPRRGYGCREEDLKYPSFRKDVSLSFKRKPLYEEFQTETARRKKLHWAQVTKPPRGVRGALGGGDRVPENFHCGANSNLILLTVRDHLKKRS